MLRQLPWTGWPSGDGEPVMGIFVTPEELQKHYGLKVENFVEDGLGLCCATHFNDEILGPVVIELFEFHPTKRATVYVDRAIDLGLAVPRLLEVLGIDHSKADIRVGY